MKVLISYTCIIVVLSNVGFCLQGKSKHRIIILNGLVFITVFRQLLLLLIHCHYYYSNLMGLL